MYHKDTPFYEFSIEVMCTSFTEWKTSIGFIIQARSATCSFCRISSRYVCKHLLLFGGAHPYKFVCIWLLFTDNAKQSVHLVAGEGLEAYIPLADMVDISAELQRLSKRLSKMQSEYDALVARLNSPSVWNYFPFRPYIYYKENMIICLKCIYYILGIQVYISAWKSDRH